MKLQDLRNDPLKELWEMANVTPDISGLSHIVFISPSYETPHECRVKVCNGIGKVTPQDMFSVDLKNLEVVAGTCKLNGDDLERVKWWIHRNRFVLLDYWKDRINTQQCFNLLKPITEGDDMSEMTS